MIAEQSYIKAKTIEQAIKEAYLTQGSFRFLAGGTDVIVNKFQGNETSQLLIDLTGIDALKHVVVIESQIEIGSLVKLDDLKKHKSIADNFPALVDAAHAVASPVIRKTATIGGNILCDNRCIYYNQTEWWRKAAGYCFKCNGDICIATGGKNNCLAKFVSDTATVLISMNACIEVVDNDKTSVIPIETIYTGDGIHPNNLDRTSLITAIIIPINKGDKTIFKKLRQRESIDFGSLMTAVTLRNNGSLKIVLGAVDAKPIIIEAKANDKLDEVIAEAVKKPKTINNDIFSRKYRKEMIGVYLKRSFQELGLM